MIKLIVTHAFADYQVGAEITDPDKVAQHSDSPNVVRVVAQNAPAPAEAEAQQSAG